MRSFEEWMDEYAKSHQHPMNQKIHKVCVPLIMFSVIGFIWSLSALWAMTFIGLCLLFYLSLNFKMFIGMFLQTVIMGFICDMLSQEKVLLTVCLIVFILSWIGQFWGHKIEGKKPSFFQDIFFLLIGPLWVTRFLYRKIGIRV
jgi:uncharacterized membrane protein YGL010W